MVMWIAELVALYFGITKHSPFAWGVLTGCFITGTALTFYWMDKLEWTLKSVMPSTDLEEE
mgnify:FL=1